MKKCLTQGGEKLGKTYPDFFPLLLSDLLSPSFDKPNWKPAGQGAWGRQLMESGSQGDKTDQRRVEERSGKGQGEGSEGQDETNWYNKK